MQENSHLEEGIQPCETAIPADASDGKNLKCKKVEKSSKVGAGRMLLWQSRFISTGCQGLMMGFITIYCTDTLKMPIALVGTLLMVSKIADVFINPFAGMLVDRTNTKFGRGRPYDLCIIGLWLCTWLMFTTPTWFSLMAKSAWLVIMYILSTGLFTALLNSGNMVYMVRAFDKQEQYVPIQTYGSIITMLGVVVFNVLFPIMMKCMATSAHGWSMFIALFSVPLLLIGLLRFFTIKEKNQTEVKSVQDKKVNLKEIGTVLKTNPYIWIIALMMLVFNIITNMGIGVYYFTYIVKDVSKMGILALSQVIILPIVFTFPPLIKKYSTKKLIVVGLLVSCAGYVVNFFAWDNFPLLMVGSIMTGGGAVPISMLTSLMIIDCAEYNEWKNSPRLEGSLASVQNLASTLGASFGVMLLGVLLSVSGYTGSALTIPFSSITMIRMLNSLIPAAFYILVIVSLHFYKLDKMIPKIRKENEQRRQAIASDAAAPQEN